jgi:thiol-disulfide isomerase/thioredoxin
MVQRRFLLLFAVVVCVIALLVALRKNRPMIASQPKAGTELAPDFMLKTIDGTSLRLSDYRGKVVLLDFWATWCAPCQEEIPHFVEWQARYGNQGLQVIGVSMDDDYRPVEKVTRELSMNYPVVIGTQELASRYGGILGLPANIVIGRDRTIVSKHLGLEDLSLLELELKAQLEFKEKR